MHQIGDPVADEVIVDLFAVNVRPFYASSLKQVEAVNRSHPSLLESAAQSKAMAEDLKAELARRATPKTAAPAAEAPTPSRRPQNHGRQP
jgi:hypothetical protein